MSSHAHIDRQFPAWVSVQQVITVNLSVCPCTGVHTRSGGTHSYTHHLREGVGGM